jgi:hypothetical protein
MNIIWNQNPLATVITLDDRDRKLLRAKLEADDLLSRVVGARMELEPESREWIGKLWRERHGRDRTLDDSVQEALSRLTLDDEAWSKELDEYAVAHEAELRKPHNGDCTCVPCSCMKCRAEGLLDLDTIKGLGKHEAHYIQSAFMGSSTLDGAIKWLAAHKPAVDAGWEGPYLERWAQEARTAHQWLVQYRTDRWSGPGTSRP